MSGLATPPCDDGVIRGAARNERGCADRVKSWVLATTIVGSSMAFIDASVVNVALPAIQSSLSAHVREAQWIINAYMLMLGALILVGGAAGDSFGRRRVFVAGVALFTGASIACGLAGNAITLIAARAVQGIGGALLVPTSLAMISAAFPEQERGRAIGTWAGASALTTALGPVLGGWLVDAWSWRVIFFVNVPIALVAAALALWRVPESNKDAHRAAIDWRGGTLAIAGFGAIAYGLTAVSESGWTDAQVLLSLSAGLVILCGFVWIEAHTAAPMMPLELFRSKNFSGANAITLLLYFALSGALFFVPFNLIRIQGYSAALAGAAFLPFSAIMGGLSRWSGGLIERYGGRGPLIVGPVIVAAGFALFAAPGIGGSYWTGFFPAMVALGFGMAVSVAPLTTTVMRATEDRYAGVASGINNATARIAGMLAVALLGAIAVGVFGARLDERLAQLQVPQEIRRALHDEVPKLAEAEVPAQVPDADRQVLQHTLKESFVWSFRVVSLIAAGLALLSAACAAWMIEPQKRAVRERGQ